VRNTDRRKLGERFAAALLLQVAVEGAQRRGPMKIIYLLSNSQKKDLFIRNLAVHIAIPPPPIEVDDLVDWARTMFPTDLRERITAAEEIEVAVAPRDPRERRVARSLSDLLGAFPGDDGRRRWLVTMIVVQVSFTPVRGRTGKPVLQWPMDVTIDGEAFIGAGAAGKENGHAP
jgi:hypothetical protein